MKLHVMIVLCVLALAVGCGKKLPDGMPKLQKVQLTFVQEGAPLDKASIKLVSEDASMQWTVGGSTDASGSVVLRTHGEYVGVPAGKYKVCVTKFENEGELPTMANPNTTIQTFNCVDAQYATPKGTSLRIDIVAGKNSFEPFNLGKPIREPVKAPGR